MATSATSMNLEKKTHLSINRETQKTYLLFRFFDVLLEFSNYIPNGI